MAKEKMRVLHDEIDRGWNLFVGSDFLAATRYQEDAQRIADGFNDGGEGEYMDLIGRISHNLGIERQSRMLEGKNGGCQEKHHNGFADGLWWAILEIKRQVERGAKPQPDIIDNSETLTLNKIWLTSVYNLDPKMGDYDITFRVGFGAYSIEEGRAVNEKLKELLTADICEVTIKTTPVQPQPAIIDGVAFRDTKKGLRVGDYTVIKPGEYTGPGPERYQPDKTDRLRAEDAIDTNVMCSEAIKAAGWHTSPEIPLNDVPANKLVALDKYPGVIWKWMEGRLYELEGHFVEGVYKVDGKEFGDRLVVDGENVRLKAVKEVKCRIFDGEVDYGKK